MRPLFDGVRIKMLAGYSALILVIAISFLFSPEPDSSDAYCGQYMHLSESAGFVFNCDAADYCMTAKFPSRLLQDSATRQSRPLYILTASVIGMPLQWIVDNSDLAVFKKFGDEAEMYVGYYAGYILINFISLLLCILMFRAIVFSIRPQPSLIYYAVLIALISNEITKTFFWTAHQQFFSLLTPLLSIWWALRIQNRQKKQAEIGRLSALCGIMMLFYGNFATVFPVLVVMAYLSDKKIHLPYLVRNVLLFLLPTLVWIGICIYKNGHYYNHEVARFRQFIWMKDALSVGVSSFFSALAANIKLFFGAWGQMAVFAVAGISSAIILRNKSGGITGPVVKAVLVSAGFSLLFFMFLGFYEERLTYTSLPLCLCLIYPALNLAKSKAAGILVFAAAIAWHFYTVLSHGPFS